MAFSIEGKLVVAISSRALFDFEEENRVFERDGEQAYIDLQYGHLDVPARHGVAFPLAKKLLAFNTAHAQRVEVVVLSKNDPVSGLRVSDADIKESHRGAEGGLEEKRAMRPSGRKADELRAVRMQRSFTRHAEGSVLVEFGDTRVLCTASVEERVPPFLKDTGRGWVTAEYGMLPRSTTRAPNARRRAASRAGARRRSSA